MKRLQQVELFIQEGGRCFVDFWFGEVNFSGISTRIMTLTREEAISLSQTIYAKAVGGKTFDNQQWLVVPLQTCLGWKANRVKENDVADYQLRRALGE